MRNRGPARGRAASPGGGKGSSSPQSVIVGFNVGLQSSECPSQASSTSPPSQKIQSPLALLLSDRAPQSSGAGRQRSFDEDSRRENGGAGEPYLGSSDSEAECTGHSSDEDGLQGSLKSMPMPIPSSVKDKRAAAERRRRCKPVPWAFADEARITDQQGAKAPRDGAVAAERSNDGTVAIAEALKERLQDARVENEGMKSKLELERKRADGLAKEVEHLRQRMMRQELEHAYPAYSAYPEEAGEEARAGAGGGEAPQSARGRRGARGLEGPGFGGNGGGGGGQRGRALEDGSGAGMKWDGASSRRSGRGRRGPKPLMGNRRQPQGATNPSRMTTQHHNSSRSEQRTPGVM